uniref:Uncharacterized protein n=1 Tax=Arundo donax TaxID=35708 RepID=A0A0A9GZ45_ARUDO
MVSWPPRCSRRKGAQNGTSSCMCEVLLMDRCPIVYVAVESAARYASQRTSLSTLEALRLRMPAKMKRKACNEKLNKTSIWTAQSLQRRATPPAIAPLIAPVVANPVELSS